MSVCVCVSVCMVARRQSGFHQLDRKVSVAVPPPPTPTSPQRYLWD